MNNDDAWIDIPASDGVTMDAYFARPASGSGPGIVILQEIFGVNQAIRGLVDEFAAEGYTVAAPDLFCRFGRRIELGYTDQDREAGFGYLTRYDFDQGVEDVRATVKALRNRPEVDGSVTVVGFCMGGRLAVLAAAKDAADAAVSFYGVRLQEHLSEISSIRCPLLLHFGDQDAHIPLEVVEAVKARADKMTNVECYVYPGAGHGFYNEHRPQAYSHTAHELSRKRTVRFLQEKC